MSDSDHQHHRVHFPEKDDAFGKDNEITLQGSPDGESISIHLGFLQIGHRYQITVELPHSLCKVKDTDLLIVRESVPGKVQSLNCKMVNISKTTHGFLIVMELFAYKEKLLKESIYVESSDHKSASSLVVIARVLGQGKGTPMLKNGIRCIGIEMEDESEASDWQGF